MSDRTIFITGATSGIGKATAEKFASKKEKVIITGRRKNKLEEIQKYLVSNYGTDILAIELDVRDRELLQEKITNLPENWKNIDVLINNAGLAVGLDPVHEGSFDDWDRMIDINLKGLLNVSRIVIPLMIARGKGHVVNIGSIAGKEVYPFGNVYCATKHAVEALTKAMRIELLKHGIKVTQVAPGAVETEFSEVRFKGDRERATKVYQGYKPLTPYDIANAIWYATSLPAHVNINDMLIMPFAQANATCFNKSE